MAAQVATKSLCCQIINMVCIVLASIWIFIFTDKSMHQYATIAMVSSKHRKGRFGALCPSVPHTLLTFDNLIRARPALRIKRPKSMIAFSEGLEQGRCSSEQSPRLSVSALPGGPPPHHSWSSSSSSSPSSSSSSSPSSS